MSCMANSILESASQWTCPNSSKWTLVLRKFKGPPKISCTQDQRLKNTFTYKHFLDILILSNVGRLITAIIPRLPDFFKFFFESAKFPKNIWRSTKCLQLPDSKAFKMIEYNVLLVFPNKSENIFKTKKVLGVIHKVCKLSCLKFMLLFYFFFFKKKIATDGSFSIVGHQ